MRGLQSDVVIGLDCAEEWLLLKCWKRRAAIVAENLEVQETWLRELRDLELSINLNRGLLWSVFQLE
ncbi:hypothetical protein SLA2020_449020 [Shorea laevis]